jgi:hypothetical protein
MRNLVITALLAASLFAASPAAQAADWSNGEFTCDLEVKELAPWYAVLNWGKWGQLQLKYSLISRPESSVTFTCYTDSLDSTKFNCSVSPLFFYDRNTLAWASVSIQYTFNPGTSKSQACEAIFKGHGITKR